VADPTRPLTLADLWLPGDVLGGAILKGWRGPTTVRRCDDWDEAVWLGMAFSAFVPRGSECSGFSPGANVRLDCRRPEVRDRAARVLGPDLLPIHAAELRGEITPGEAAGLVWCSVVRREAGLGVVQAILGETERLAHITYRKYIAGERVGRVRDGDAAQLALGVALREPGGILLLPLPDGVVGRLETRA